MNPNKPIAIYFRREAYSETTTLRSTASLQAGPLGLMGREVASQAFLRALLKHGQWSSLEALIESESDRSSLVEVCKQSLEQSEQPRRVHVTPIAELSRWMQNPPAEILHFPYPQEERFAWGRNRRHEQKFATSGITHTLCSMAGLEALWRLATAPWEHYDRLVCTSHAVASMVRAVTDTMCQYLEERFGGKCEMRIGLEHIPLGVDVDQRRPARPTARHEVRRRLGIGDDKFVVLFVGRLSHHAKSQPFPMFVAAQRAAEKLGQDVFLVQCGWFSNAHVRDAYERTQQLVAPNVRSIVVDGLDPWWRQRVWDAADVFVSLADSIQETFGLTNIEAMAHGLPVVASDWDGYRDTVADGLTGFLIPTLMVRDATPDATRRLVTRQINYDVFLAEVGQTVAVSIPDACDAIARLAMEPDLRRQFGMAGRQRVERRFSWEKVITAYEALWQLQRDELAAAHRRPSVFWRPAIDRIVTTEPEALADSSLKTNFGLEMEAASAIGVSHEKFSSARSLALDDAPAIYPSIEPAFADYPSRWLDGSEFFVRSGDKPLSLTKVLGEPLLNHSLRWTENSGKVIAAYESLPSVFGLRDLELAVEGKSGSVEHARSLLAWLLKYGLVQVDRASKSSIAARTTLREKETAPHLTLVTTCMGRLEDLQHTLPIMVAQSGARVVVVDYSCPQKAGAWVRETFPKVQVVEVPGKSHFDRSDAKNRGVRAVVTPWICLVDADMILDERFVERTSALLRPDRIVRSDAVVEGTGGTFFFEKTRFDLVEGHDPVFCGWGEQDADLVNALQFSGASLHFFPAALIHQREHGDFERTRFHADTDRGHSHTINRLYRAAKWDWAKLAGTVPSLAERKLLWAEIARQVDKLLTGESEVEIVVKTGSMNWNPHGLSCLRTLRYAVEGKSQ